MSGDDADQVERALIAEREVADAKRAGRKLGVELLNDFAQLFGGLAAFYQPHPAGIAPNPNADPVQFEKWARLAVETAARLAPYQSPQFRAILTAPAPDASGGRGKVTRFTLAIFERELGSPERVLVERQRNGRVIDGEAVAIDGQPAEPAEPMDEGVTRLFPRRADRAGG